MADAISKVMDGLPDKTYFRIGEVAKITKVKPYVLRFWESEFKMMAPPKSRSKQRMYRKRDIETILHIKQLLYKERFTIEGARKRLSQLKREGDAPVVETGPAAAEAGEAAVVDSGQLSRIRSELEALRDYVANA